MKNCLLPSFVIRTKRGLRSVLSRFLLLLILWPLFTSITLNAQTTTFQTIPAGSFIVNMGVSPQTIANGLRPYGLLFALLEANVPVHWAINPTKAKDGIDFSHAGVDYRGGAFIIEAKYRTSAVNSIISSWQGQGVVGTSITSAASNVPIFLTFSFVPKWTLDQDNGLIAVPYFANAGIPPRAHGGTDSKKWKDPAQLDCCDDIFVMPHAYPTWLTHQRLISWNLECKGNIWAGCKAVSLLENMVNTANRSQQANFLSIKDPAWTGTSGDYALSNSLIRANRHRHGSPPYTFNNLLASEPIAQYLGTIDAATLNGAEQIYIPRQGIVSDPTIFNANAIARWRPETKILVYDPTHVNVTSPNLTTLQNVASVLVYGRGFGDPNRGLVMYQGGHSFSNSTAPANVAAQRAFFNFSFYSIWDKQYRPNLIVMPSIIYADQTNVKLEYELRTGTGEIYTGPITSSLWSSTCGGTFNTTTSNPTFFTPPPIQRDTDCTITIVIEDACGRKSFNTVVTTIKCRLDVETSVVNVCGQDQVGGIINMTPIFGIPGYTWTWTRAGGGSGSGTGLSITGLSTGVYTVTLTDRNGSGCSYTFTVTVNVSPQITISESVVHVSCPGGSDGAINLNIGGGTPPFSFVWTDGPTTQNRSGLSAGSYTVIVTDNNGCTAQKTILVGQPAPLVITPSVTHVSCKGFNNGMITLVVSGGVPPYTFQWNDGNTNRDRTGLVAGSYSVTVTDSKSCRQTLSGIIVNEPAQSLLVTLASKQDILCSDQLNGSISINVSGGTPNPVSPLYTFAWTGPGGFTASTQNISGLAAGNYMVTVTDANGCIERLQVTIFQSPPISLSFTKKDPTCPPEEAFIPPVPPLNHNGEITLTVSGGTPGYSFLWTASNGGVIPPGQQANQSLTGLVAGTYSVVVKDANNCEATTTVTLIYLNPNPVQPSSIE